MTSPASLVREFDRAMGFEHPERPTLRDYDTCELRIRLIKEEAREAIQAIRFEGLTEIAKELADLVYVAYGAALAYGIDLDRALDEVHRSNLSKVGPGGEVTRRDDGKVTKGEHYREPDMEAAVFGVPA